MYPVLAFVVCISAAVLAIGLSRDTSYAASIPLFFLVVVTGTAVLWGHVGTIAGLVGAALLFAMLLFPPIGSVAVASETARANLGWMLLLGIPTAFLSGRTLKQDQRLRTPKK